MLNGVCSGFIEGISCGNVGVNFGIAVVPHRNRDAADICNYPSGGLIDNSETSVNLVAATSKRDQHLPCFVFISRFVQLDAIENHGRISSNNDIILRRSSRSILGFQLSSFNNVPAPIVLNTWTKTSAP